MFMDWLLFSSDYIRLTVASIFHTNALLLSFLFVCSSEFVLQLSLKPSFVIFASFNLLWRILREIFRPYSEEVRRGERKLNEKENYIYIYINIYIYTSLNAIKIIKFWKMRWNIHATEKEKQKDHLRNFGVNNKITLKWLPRYGEWYLC